MLFFTCIKLVVHVLAYVHVIACIKWRRLQYKVKGSQTNQVLKDHMIIELTERIFFLETFEGFFRGNKIASKI